MGQKLKSQKGDISITDFQGRIRLRWRVAGERYSLNLPFSYSTENLHHASVKVAEIKLDMMKGCFDSTLEKYKPKVDVPVLPAVKKDSPKPKVMYVGHLISKYDDWTSQIKNVDINLSIDYFDVRKLLERYINVPLDEIAGKIGVENWCTTTYNKRLSFLRNFFTWLFDTGIINSNPLLYVSKRRDKKKRKNERRKPLTEDEISTFLEAIRKNTFCHKSSAFRHSFYYPFLKFIFLTGVRNAEAIGLRVKHINFEDKHIEISETFTRTTKGSNHAARISKGTKTGNTRYLPLSDELSVLLLSLIACKEPDDFVFLSPKGLSIDDQMLQKRTIKPVLVALGIGDRDLYAARHSFGTRAVQKGMVITDVAYLMGHSTVETTIRNYVSVERRAIILPTLDKCK